MFLIVVIEDYDNISVESEEEEPVNIFKNIGVT